MPMNIITLITDWHQKDYYAGAVKGRILNLCPDARIVDIAHDIPSFNIQKAAFILRNTYPHFPEGTIHLVGVMAEGKKNTLLIQHRGHYFIMADSGMAGMVFPDGPEKIFRITSEKKDSLFPFLDYFVPIACALASGKKPDDIGKAEDKIKVTNPVRAAIDEGIIAGMVIYVDSYGNTITNITREIFERFGKRRPFEIYPGTGSSLYRISRINKHYYDTPPGDILALFNSLELLEIAISHGNAAELLGLENNSSIRIRFKD